MHLLALFSLAAIPLSLYMAFVYAPTEAFMGDVQRLLYIHVGFANSAYVALGIVFIASIIYLKGRRPRWDALAVAAAEVGVLCTTATLVTGSIWARKVWGWWWTWDPRLTTTLVLWIIYVVYLLVRRAVDEPGRRARFSAIVAVLGAFDLPLVRYSVEWWRSIHPANIASGGTTLHPDMRIAMIVAIISFLLVNLLFVWMRYRLERVAQDLERVAAARWSAGA